jgi:hypothetical protein
MMVNSNISWKIEAVSNPGELKKKLSLIKYSPKFCSDQEHKLCLFNSCFIQLQPFNY